MLAPYALLVAAIGIEVGATAALPRTRGFHDLSWSVPVMGAYVVSIWMLGLVVREVPISVAYAVWSGLGTAAIATIGVLLLGDEVDALKVTALAMIIVGVVLLNLHHAH